MDAAKFMVAANTPRSREALMLRQALSLCASITQEADRFEAAFFESVRVLVQRLRSAGAGKKISLKEMND